jgi:hypothetical protein
MASLGLLVRLGHQVRGPRLGALGEALFQVVEVDAPGQAGRFQHGKEMGVVGVAPADHPPIIRAKSALSLASLLTPGASSTPLARSTP